MKQPTKIEVMLQLERMIHQWDDEPGRADYHPDALWLEEVRHIIHLVERENAGLRDALGRIAAIPNNSYGGDWDEIEEARKIASDILSNAKTLP